MSNILAKETFTVNDIADELQKQAFVAIRHKVCNFEDSSNNDEIVGYVRGVCEYESLLYSQLQKNYFQAVSKGLKEVIEND